MCCLIISKPAGKTLKKELYEEGFKSNADGCGISYVDNGELIVFKGLMTFDAFYEELLKIEQKELVIHFRNASVGMAITQAMCHPFTFDTGTQFVTGKGDKARPQFEFAIAHNGKLDWRDTKIKSDSACFIEDVLAPHFERDPYFLDDESGITLLTKAIGMSNKMVIMRYDAEADKSDVYIINPKGGFHDKEAHEKWGCWFSNYSYVKTVHPYRYQGGRGGFGSEYLFPHGEGEWEDHRPLGATQPTGEFSIPDSAGWRWSFIEHLWINDKTHVRATYLSTRPNRPPYMLEYDKDPSKFRGGSERREGPNPPIVVTVVDDKDEDLKHLNSLERKVLYRIAGDYSKGSFSLKNHMSNKEALAMLRSDIRTFFAEAHDLPVEELDKWILKQGKGNVTSEWLKKPTKSIVLSQGDSI